MYLQCKVLFQVPKDALKYQRQTQTQQISEL